MGINANRVKPSIREAVLMYQRECMDALHSYWTTGKAENPRAEAADPREGHFESLIAHVTDAITEGFMEIAAAIRDRSARTPWESKPTEKRKRL